MPTTINGCGTTYYGKRDLETIVDTCSSCGKTSALETYETRLYFVLFLIPVVPLGRKKIIDHCHMCSKHIAMPLKDWQTASHRTSEAMELYRQNRGNTELAEDVLVTSMSIRDQKSFITFAGELEEDFTDNAKILTMIATGYDLFGQLENTTRLLQLALNVSDDDDTRELLADCYLRQDQPEQAEPLLQHVIQERIPDRIDLLIHLAGAWQTRGDHERALNVFRECESIDPSIEQNKNFKALKDASVENRGTVKAIAPDKILGKVKRQNSFRKFKQVAPVVLVMAAAIYLLVAYLQGLSPTVYLANGIGHAYTVRVNGTDYLIAKNSTIPISVRDTKIKIEVPELQNRFTPEILSLKSDFLTRPFDDTVFIINPDRNALLSRDRVYYGSNSSTGPKPESELFTGKTLHVFENLDHVFEEFPEEIFTSSSASRVAREGLFLVPQMENTDPSVLIRLLQKSIEKETRTQMVKRQLLFSPNNWLLLSLADDLLSSEEIMQFIKPMLSERPTLVYLHRAYQDAAYKTGHAEELEETYKTYSAEEPENGELLYLAARACNDWKQASILYHRAAQAEPPSANACLNLAARASFKGDNQKALSFAKQAINIRPDDYAMQIAYLRFLLLANELEKAVEYSQQTLKIPFPNNTIPVANAAYARFLLDKTDTADEVFARVEKQKAELPDFLVDEQVVFAKAGIAYASGKTDEYCKLMQESIYPQSRLNAAVAERNLETIQKTMAELIEPEADVLLTAYVATMLLDDQASAQKYLSDAIELFSKEQRDERWYASALRGEAEVTEERILATGGIYQSMALELTVLGLALPESRRLCFELAERVNTDLRFPHNLVADVIDKYREK